MGVSRSWSDQHDPKPQIVGHLAPQDTTVIRGATGDGQFTVFYDGQVRLMAVDSINRPDDQMIAGRLIGASRPRPRSRLLDLKTLETFD